MVGNHPLPGESLLARAFPRKANICVLQEWYLLWAEPSEMDELTSFFDKFLKEEDNGFEKHTPKVRTTVLRFGKNDPYYNIAEEDYPLPRTDYRKLYLTHSNGTLSDQAIQGDVGVVSHD